MNTIIKNNSKEIIIKKSKFISFAIEINSKEEADNLINTYKEKYKDATHCCYAYIINNYEKMSDDGEPSGTAGLPILDILKKKNINNTLIIVIRYFGGIKLGANGLVRAYVSSAIEALENNICSLEDGYYLKIKFDYNNEKEINYILKNSLIISKEYKDKVIYEINIKEEIFKKLENLNIEILIKEQKKIKVI